MLLFDSVCVLIKSLIANLVLNSSQAASFSLGIPYSQLSTHPWNYTQKIKIDESSLV